MLSSISDLISEEEAFSFLVRHLHPTGLHCPKGHGLPSDQKPHMRDRAPLMEYRCRECGAVFHAFTGTALARLRYPSRVIVLLLRGMARGESTMRLAGELGVARPHLLGLRQRLQTHLQCVFSPLAIAPRAVRGRRDVSERWRKRHPASRS
jgi:transposase-like protein